MSTHEQAWPLDEVERTHRARLLAVAALFCALHGPLDLILAPREAWPILLLQRGIWFCTFLLGVYLTRTGRDDIAAWAATVMGVFCALFTVPLVLYTGVSESPLLLWFVAYPPLAAAIVPSDARSVLATAVSSTLCLLGLVTFQPTALVATATVAGLLTGLLSYLASRRNLRTRLEQRAAHEAAARAEERIAASEDRARQAEQVLESHRLATLGSLTAGVAHDLANYAQTLEGSVAVLDDDPEAMDDILETARAIQRLCRDVLTPLQIHADDLASLRPTVESARRMAGGPLRDCTVVLDVDDLVAKGSTHRLIQVVVNLLTNAALAVGPGGQIHVVAQRGDTGLLLTVEDNGPGIPAALREKVFEPFFTTRGRNGTGLGLHLCRRFAQEMGGTLHAEEAPGGGARMVLALREAT